MADAGTDIAILAAISGGIYSGGPTNLTNKQINKDYRDIINGLLGEDYYGKKLGNHFERIIFPLFGKTKFKKFN